MSPFSVVENTGFTDMFQGLESWYTVAYFLHTVRLDIYTCLMQQNKHRIDIKETISLATTTDSWTSRIQKTTLLPISLGDKESDGERKSTLISFWWGNRFQVFYFVLGNAVLLKFAICWSMLYYFFFYYKAGPTVLFIFSMQVIYLDDIYIYIYSKSTIWTRSCVCVCIVCILASSSSSS